MATLGTRTYLEQCDLPAEVEAVIAVVGADLGPAIIPADRAKLRQALHALRKLHPLRSSATVRTCRLGFAFISISDDGLPEGRAQALERFWRADGSRRRAPRRLRSPSSSYEASRGHMAERRTLSNGEDRAWQWKSVFQPRSVRQVPLPRAEGRISAASLRSRLTEIRVATPRIDQIHPKFYLERLPELIPPGYYQRSKARGIEVEVHDRW